MGKKCKACGACDSPSRCECCGKCANCGQAHAFPGAAPLFPQPAAPQVVPYLIPASPFPPPYYEPLDPWRITCEPTWQVDNVPSPGVSGVTLVPRAPTFTSANTGCH